MSSILRPELLSTRKKNIDHKTKEVGKKDKCAVDDGTLGKNKMSTNETISKYTSIYIKSNPTEIQLKIND